MTTSRVVNSYAPIAAPLAPGDIQVPIGAVRGGSFASGDLVMLWQTTGLIPEPASGMTGPFDVGTGAVGHWELARLSGASGGTLSLTAPLLAAFPATVSQVVRVPEYTTLTINAGGSLQALAWDGSSGGMVAALVSGTVTNNATGSISANAAGFRGGLYVDDMSGSLGCTGLDDPAPVGARKGEGIAVTRYGPAQSGRGRVANGAGGGVCWLSGGGGGGNGGSGGQGGNTELTIDGNRVMGGQGGGALTTASERRVLLLGGGGGAGHGSNGAAVAGAAGGGVLFLRANALAGSGGLLARGAAGVAVTTQDAGSGGGAGGTIHLRVAGNTACGTSDARGGNGGTTNGVDMGPGGGGGGGRVLRQSASGSCAPTAPGGSTGVQPDAGAPGGSNYGAQAGNNGWITTLIGGYARAAAPTIVTPANGNRINSATPAVTGSGAQANRGVAIYVDGVLKLTPVADGAGNFTATVSPALGDGSHQLQAAVYDEGDLGLPSMLTSFTVDTTPPPAPALLVPFNGSVSSVSVPTLIGTAEPGSTVSAIVDGTTRGTATADGSGNWSFNVGTALPDGPHTAKARATDAAGNTSTDSATNTFTVDTTAPAAPFLVIPANGTMTGNSLPTVGGTAEPGSTVNVFVDGTSRGTATADGAGNWNFTVPTALADGPHVAKARATDSAGNVSADSDSNTFTVDTVAPAAPILVTPVDGNTTGNSLPTVSGTAEPGSSVTVIVDGTSRGIATADGAGNWSFTVLTPLSDGPHTAKARATDAAGNTSTDSAASTFTIDTTAPPAPVLANPANGSTTGNTLPTVNGTAEPSSSVSVIVDGTPRGTATANASGDWSFTLATPLADGPHTARARATDAVGNTGPDSATSTFTVDTIAPAAPVLANPANGSTTGNTLPTVNGTAEPSSSVSVIVDGTPRGTATANGSGDWSFTLATPLTDGPHTAKATASDAAGNTSPDSNGTTFTVDTQPPPAPVVVAPANGGTAVISQPVVSGTAEPGSSVTVVIDGATAGTVIASGAGAWQLTPAPLLDGTHTAKARARDGAGNTGVDSATSTFQVLNGDRIFAGSFG
ncbi:Ig-like domain-containing protein [Tahibacter sp. UC22_41]|uniref:adventurous gliding motility protein AgmC n=1 Tax=Tahibacter sp. UC22_41 TaxID=3350178 RepID=UPI0036D97637